MSVSIIYYTDGHAPEGVAAYCLERLRRQAREGGHQLIEIRQAPEAPRCLNSIYRNILTGIDAAKRRVVAVAEHDCVYGDGYFDRLGKTELSYSTDVVYLTEDGFGKRDLPYAPLSTMAGGRDIVREAVLEKMEEPEPETAEPQIETAEYRPHSRGGWVMDIRHGKNFTGGRDQFIGKYFSEFQGIEHKKIWSEIMGRKKKRRTVSKAAAKELKISIVIPARVEKMLKWTVENVRRTAPGAEIVIVHDGWTRGVVDLPGLRQFVPWVTPQGVGQAREYGLMQAANDICILLDAHMDFECGWAECMAEEIVRNPRAIVCTRSAVLREDRMDIDNPEKIQGGARINFASDVPFDPEWRPHAPGEVQCVLGGAYALSKAWYFGGLKRPWGNAFGWGTSEQVISLVNWFAGGENILSDCLTAHLYRRAAEVIETRFTPMTRAGMWYNRLRFIDLLPVDAELKRGAVEKVRSRMEYRKHEQFISDLLLSRPRVNDDEIKTMIGASGRTMGDYIARWYPEGVAWPEAPRKAAPVASPVRRVSAGKGGIMSDRPGVKFL